MKRQNKNWPLHFEAGCRKRRLNPASFFGLYCVVVLFSGLVNVCFCCVRFSFSIPSQEIGLGNVSEMTYFVWIGIITAAAFEKKSLVICYSVGS